MGLLSSFTLALVLSCYTLNISALNFLVSKKSNSRIKLFATSTSLMSDSMSKLYQDLQSSLPSKEPSEADELKLLIAAGTTVCRIF